ncbi:E3 ubiquitin-protein ligase Topors-like [Trichechus manatus latirostris]|uniref:RING-type E3 ubiquitin transferase n=1 Tax=Trichechus manatus latirostris TaxID=127582 RepID=A0A2Y9FV76_TRIMA|nr:E3 ubiquitin-protein ligase Topors-like [Trichechus manatus latirostris]
MPFDRSSDCECRNCLEDIQNESDWNSCCNENGNDSLYSRSRKKFTRSFVQSLSSQCCSTRPESDTKEEDVVFLSSEDESSLESSQNNHLGLTSEGIPRKTRPLKELTIQELLSEFGDSKKFQPNSTSLGHFRDQVVMKFRRALYYSGIWVSHVQGYRMEKHFSANYFKRNPGCLHRLIPWLKRELTAVYGDYGYTVKNILTTILQHMTEYDLDSESFINLLQPYLLQHTHHFLHEFISFVHSPYNMETYDQRAIYRCPAPSPSVKKKSIASAPVSPLPEDQTLLVSHHDTRQYKNAQGQWNNEEKTPSGLKPFPNGNSSLKKSEIPPVHHKTASKTHAWIKDKLESGDHKGTLSTNSFLNWATPRERGTSLLNCKTHVQDRKTEGMKLFPGHVQDLGKSETTASTLSTPSIFNQGQPWKYSLRERRGLSPDQQMNFQKKEAERNKYSDSSPKIFQRRLSRERSLITCKARKRDPSWSCMSETTLSPKRESRKLCSFKKKRMKCKQSSQFAEVGSHSSRTIKRRSRSNTQRSKSWCIGYRKRSVSRESSNFSLGGSCKGEHFVQNICCEPSKEKNAHAYELNHGRGSSAMVQCMKLSAPTREKPKCPSTADSTFHAGSRNSPTYLQTERHRSPSKQKIKHRTTFPRARKNSAVEHRKNKCQCPDKQTTEEASNKVWDQDDKRQMSSPSEYAPSCRRQIQKKQKNLNLQKCHRAKNEHKGDTASETQRCKLF